mmetsp:Transcript_5652/g.14364  ORF Transcript_5652/g.14364 Transcript_5652/m.14364 type:complete len:316 (-) Transcript_5652:128-1075(-)
MLGLAGAVELAPFGLHTRGEDPDTSSCLAPFASGSGQSYAPTEYPAMPTCCWYSNSTCCAGEDSGKLMQVVEYELASFRKSYNLDVNGDCYASYANIMCSICSAENSVYDRRVEFSWTIFACEAACAQLYAACKLEIKLFPAMNSVDACALMNWRQDQYTLRVVVRDPQFECFAGISSEEVRAADCLPTVLPPFPLQPSGSSSSTPGRLNKRTAIYAIVVAFTVLFLLLVVFFVVGRFRRSDQHTTALFTPLEDELELRPPSAGTSTAAHHRSSGSESDDEDEDEEDEERNRSHLAVAIADPLEQPNQLLENPDM